MAYIDGEKWLSVGKLKAILSNLPDNYELQVNAMGNILVEGKEVGIGEEEFSFYAGYIDFSTEEFVTDEV